MNTQVLQEDIFRQIRGRLPAGQSMAEEIAGLLNISTDSAYRRIRGEKMITLEELSALCQHYHLSLDNLLQLNGNAFLFQGSFVQPSTFQFDHYLKSIIEQVRYMSSFADRRMYYLCKDIPIFHHFHFRELAAFKHYFWMKTILQHPDFATKKFRLDEYDDQLFELGKKSLHYYNQVDSVEIWNIETINSTLRQIDFYKKQGMYAEPQDLERIYQAFEKLLLHLEAQADAGYKFEYGDAEKKPLSSFQMYYNEVILGDNSILSVLNGSKTVFLIHSVINFMITRDTVFCEHTYESIQNLIKKSTLISKFSERERSGFFKYLRKRIITRKEQLNR